MNETAFRQRFSEALKNYQNSFFLLEFLGLKISYKDDKCICIFPVDDFLLGPFGSYHGGLVTTVIDITMAHLSKKITGSAGATIELQTKYLRKLNRGPGCCEVQFLSQDNSIGQLAAKVWDADAFLIAEGTAAWRLPN